MLKTILLVAATIAVLVLVAAGLFLYFTGKYQD